jgi:hypothetical protein
MGTVKNISADARHVPSIDRTVEPGETVEVADELLDPAHRSWDPDVWQITGGDPRSLAELKAEAEKRGLPVSGTKSDLIARLAQPAAEPGA